MSVSQTRAMSAMCARICSAPSAQFNPTETGEACCTAFQNASGVWPDSSRPERSVMVPEIITGTSTPRSAHCSAMA